MFRIVANYMNEIKEASFNASPKLVLSFEAGNVLRNANEVRVEHNSILRLHNHNVVELGLVFQSLMPSTKEEASTISSIKIYTDNHLVREIQANSVTYMLQNRQEASGASIMEEQVTFNCAWF